MSSGGPRRAPSSVWASLRNDQALPPSAQAYDPPDLDLPQAIESRFPYSSAATGTWRIGLGHTGRPPNRKGKGRCHHRAYPP
jgi:hypothetical protein